MSAVVTAPGQRSAWWRLLQEPRSLLGVVLVAVVLLAFPEMRHFTKGKNDASQRLGIKALPPLSPAIERTWNSLLQPSHMAH